MADRLAEKYKSPEVRGDESYSRGSHAAQVSDDVLDNRALLTGKCTFKPLKTVEQFTATAAVGSTVIFDSASLNKFGDAITLFNVKTLTISSDVVSTVEIIVEDEAGGVGVGTPIYTFFMAANQTIVVPFGFGDKLQAGVIAPSDLPFQLTVTGSAGNVWVTASGQASTALI